MSATIIDVARHRRRRSDRPGGGGRTGGRRPFGRDRRTPSPAGHGNQHAQQRRHPRRHLLSGRDAEGAAVRRRGASASTRSARRTTSRTIAAGSSIVATTDAGDRPRSKRWQRRGAANGVRRARDRRRRPFVRAREPHVAAVAALWSPHTGRRRGRRRWCRALLRLARVATAPSCCAARTLLGGDATADGIRAVDAERETIAARTVVNAAGLYADEVSAVLGGEPFTIYPCRGEYAELRAVAASLGQRARLSAPACRGHGLGVHLTKTTGGAVLARSDGPISGATRTTTRATAMPLEDFVEPTRAAAARRHAGRSRLRRQRHPRRSCHPPEEAFADFMIRRRRESPGLIHAAGIDSPGLTSCLAIGARVAGLVQRAARVRLKPDTTGRVTSG